jgi:hypothetical protein
LWSFSSVNQIFQFLDIEAFGLISLEKTNYSQNPAVELLVLGALSLILTVTNVICVYLMGYVFLRIKIEVATLSTEEERQFWKHDVPIARDYNKTLIADDGRRLREQLDEYLNTDNFRGVGAELLKQDLYPHTHTWSPIMQKLSSKKDQPRPSVIEFNSYYKSMTSSDDQNKSVVKQSEPIATPKASTSSHNTHESLSEPLRRQTTYVDIESYPDNEGKVYGKFKVTPAKDLI